MKIILLSGQSLENKEWIEQVQSSFKSKYSDTSVMYYEHWSRGEGKADASLETERFLNLINTTTEEYILFAKSIGSVIFLNSLKKLSKYPTKVILVGVPLHMAKDSGYDFYNLKTILTFPVTIYQKKFDPYCSYTDLKTIEGGNVVINEYRCINEDEDNHNYSNFSTLLKLV